MNRSGIYAIINQRNGKAYVGSAAHIEQRWRHHLKLVRANIHHSILFQRAWNKYTATLFAWIVLERVPVDQLLKREQYWIDTLRSANPNHGYNICSTAGNTAGRKLSNSQIKTFARYWLGKKRTDDFKQKISAYRTGLKSTEETKRKIRAAKTGKPNGRKGVPHTIETRNKIKAALTGRSLSVMTRNNIRSGLIMRWSSVSLEDRLKQSQLMNAAKYGIKPTKELTS